MGLSLPHLIVLALVVLLLFGRGKISELMGDFGKGIKSFKQGINEETVDRPVTPPPAQIPVQPVSVQPAPAPVPVQPTINGEPVDANQPGQR
jgi:sec-independent protein translocase protein TatA